jgi:hypothetical protein
MKERLFDLAWMLNSEVDGCSVGHEISGVLGLEDL